MASATPGRHRPDRPHGTAGPADPLGEGLDLRAGRIRAAGQDPQHGNGEQPGGQDAQGEHGGLVGPLDIVDRDQDRLPGRGLVEDGAQTLDGPHGLGCRTESPLVRGVYQRRRRRAQPGQQRRQRGHPVEFVAIPGTHHETARGGQVPCRAQQGRLADARRTLQQDRRPRAGRGGPDGLSQLVDLRLPTAQQAPAHKDSMPGRSSSPEMVSAGRIAEDRPPSMVIRLRVWGRMLIWSVARKGSSYPLPVASRARVVPPRREFTRSGDGANGGRSEDCRYAK